MSGPEKNFENKIKDYLAKHNCYFVKYFANRMTKAGIPDILACVNGYFVAIEVKAENGHPSELQIYNVKKINETYGFAVIVRPSDFENLKKMIEYLRDGQTCNARVVISMINNKFFLTSTTSK